LLRVAFLVALGQPIIHLDCEVL